MLFFLLAQAAPIPPVLEIDFPTVDVNATAPGPSLPQVRERAPARFASAVKLRASFDAEIARSTDEVPR